MSICVFVRVTQPTFVLVSFGVVVVTRRRAGLAADDATEIGSVRLIAAARFGRVTMRTPSHEKLLSFLWVAFWYAHCFDTMQLKQLANACPYFTNVYSDKHDFWV